MDVGATVNPVNVPSYKTGAENRVAYDRWKKNKPLDEKKTSIISMGQSH